ncbi:TPA: hypothetical protein OE729_000017 [Escherichia coli]|nr:hypothetical protein [Escherichia coli]HCP6731403.1 hypothetical protein [Escherichia coli]HCP6748172.1 hypothetical protein [Escherichia coli]HCP6868844.1 hypothetical protein [Escherichia coli]
MSTLTKEWLQQTIAELEEERDATPGAVNEDAAKALAAMELALASLEADVVAWTDEQELRDVEKYGCGYLFTANPVTPNADPHRVIKLYAAPPAPVSVPEPIKRNDADGWWMYKGRRVGGGCAEWYNLALDDCRAAMLQGADGNSPVFPDGWKLVPVELTGAMTNAMTDAILDDLHNVDVWRSVLAAAPQQEVK